MTISGAAAFSVAVVAAAGDGCRVEPTGQILGDGSVCTAGQPAKQLDARLRQGALRPGTDAAAEDNIHMVLHQKACEQFALCQIWITTFNFYCRLQVFVFLLHRYCCL